MCNMVSLTETARYMSSNEDTRSRSRSCRGHGGVDDAEQQRQMVLASKVALSIPRENRQIVCGCTLVQQHAE